MVKQSGQLSVNMANMFEIVKKALYSERDIFIRELVANAIDAIRKLKHLELLGEYKKPQDKEYEIIISIDKENKVLSIQDNGIAMTLEEVEKYINQVAFSGAEDFAAKYEKSERTIGHFGLGFNSAFMVANKVELETLSYLSDSEPVLWSCCGDPNYVISDSSKTNQGTEVRLFLNEDSLEFLEEHKIKNLLSKYCKFLPYPIKLNDNIINEKEPLWLKLENKITEEDYVTFCKESFPHISESLFHIHLNSDFPVPIKGILYFPKNQNLLEQKNHIDLYCNRVFVSNDCSELFPPYLSMLHGHIDCPEIPLNVSRSFIQREAVVVKVFNYIISKLGKKIKELHKNTEKYQELWSSLETFVKIVSMSNSKFYESVKDCILFPTAKGEFITLSKYIEKYKQNIATEEGQEPKYVTEIVYVTNKDLQSIYLAKFEQKNKDVLMMDHMIDMHFIQFLESSNTNIRFSRVDSDLNMFVDPEQDKLDSLENTEDESHEANLLSRFKEYIGNPSLVVELKNLTDNKIPAMLNIPEYSRRLREISVMMQSPNAKNMPVEFSLTLNKGNKAIQKMLDCPFGQEQEQSVCKQIYYMSLLPHALLKTDQIGELIDVSNSNLTNFI